MHHLAVVFGDIRDGVDVPVRLHLESVVDDVFSASKRPDDSDPGPDGLEGRGVVVYLREGSVGVGKRAARRMVAEEREDMPKRRTARTSGARSDWAHRS
jgi:3,4-dihydroxy 2-butanone 4-phosphate synthase/GTP cyclohydrolase II